MHLTTVENFAVLARIAALVGAAEFDRLFAGVSAVEVEGDILFLAAANDELAEEIEATYWREIAAIASLILKRPVGLVMVIPSHAM